MIKLLKIWKLLELPFKISKKSAPTVAVQDGHKQNMGQDRALLSLCHC